MSSALGGLAAALGGGGPGGPPPGPPGGGADSGGNEPGDQENYTDPVDALDDAEQALHAYIQMEPDEADRAVAAQCLQNIIKLKAKDSMDMQKLQSSLQGAPLSLGGPQG